MSRLTSFYPVILIPALIRQFCTENPLPVLEVAVTPKSSPPFPPRLPITHHSSYSLVIQFWMGSVGVVILVSWLLGMSLIAFLSSLLCSSLSAAAALSYLRFVDSQVQAHYKQRLVEYQQQLSEYESHQWRCLQSKGKDIEPYNALLQERSKLLKNMLSRIVQPPANQGKKRVQQGVSETEFFVDLCRYFSGVYDCFMGINFPIPGTSLHYTADFILVHQPTGLAMDIEIDEPYEGRTGKPHHCVDRDKDHRRNQFFLARNWVVIRFSELQVAEFPDSCCLVIARLIAQITGDYRGLFQLQNVANLVPHKQWSFREATYMAKTKYRNSYLQKKISFN